MSIHGQSLNTATKQSTPLHPPQRGKMEHGTRNKQEANLNLRKLNLRPEKLSC